MFGTVGYQAPEIAAAGPSVTSDLFTVARTLAVMSFDFRGYQSTFRYTLPSPDEVPLFARHNSLYRLLLRATATDPDERFQSADELTDQLQGVLREVVAHEQGRPVPGLSKLFTGPLRTGAEPTGWRALPRPQVAADDPAAGYLAAITVSEPPQALAQLSAAPERTVEVRLAIAAASVELGYWPEMEEELAAIEADDAWDWRVPWFRGVAELARERGTEARAQFTSVYQTLPGELAPKLALGVACELAGDHAAASAWYDIVSRTDPAFTVASFGLARARLAAGDRAGALAAYERVPDSSSAFIDAQTARVRCLSGEGATVDELLLAGAAVERLEVSGEQRTQLTAEVLGAALPLVERDAGADPRSERLLGHELSERASGSASRAPTARSRGRPGAVPNGSSSSTRPTASGRGHGPDLRRVRRAARERRPLLRAVRGAGRRRSARFARSAGNRECGRCGAGTGDRWLPVLRRAGGRRSATTATARSAACFSDPPANGTSSTSTSRPRSPTRERSITATRMPLRFRCSTSSELRRSSATASRPRRPATPPLARQPTPQPQSWRTALADATRDGEQTTKAAIAAANDAVVNVEWTTRADRVDPSCTLVSALCRGGTDRRRLGGRQPRLLARGCRRHPADRRRLVGEAADRGRAWHRAQAFKAPFAHAITNWVGPDALEPGVLAFCPERAGRLLLCTDGLWNYAPTDPELAALLEALPAGSGPAEVARSLTGAALDRGGRDNITVVVVECNPLLQGG